MRRHKHGRHSGAPRSGEPGIHNHDLRGSNLDQGVWIPDSLASLAPRNDGCGLRTATSSMRGDAHLWTERSSMPPREAEAKAVIYGRSAIRPRFTCFVGDVTFARERHLCAVASTGVIPGRRAAASPETITTIFADQITIRAYGFWTPSLRSGPGMTAADCGQRRHLCAATSSMAALLHRGYGMTRRSDRRCAR